MAFEFRKSYKSILRPNLRKESYLDATCKYLDKGDNLFFDLTLSLYGGVTPEMLSLDKEVDTDVICATSWFKLVPLKDAKKQILQPNILKKLIKYLGHQPSERALEFENLVK